MIRKVTQSTGDNQQYNWNEDDSRLESLQDTQHICGSTFDEVTQ